MKDKIEGLLYRMNYRLRQIDDNLTMSKRWLGTQDKQLDTEVSFEKFAYEVSKNNCLIHEQVREAQTKLGVIEREIESIRDILKNEG